MLLERPLKGVMCKKRTVEEWWKEILRKVWRVSQETRQTFTGGMGNKNRNGREGECQCYKQKVLTESREVESADKS